MWSLKFIWQVRLWLLQAQSWEKLQRRKNWDYKEEEECRQKAEFLNMEIM